MKKKVFILGIIALIFLTGCNNKTAITTDIFTEKAKENGLLITDAISQFKDATFIKNATIAQSVDGWQIEFYILEDENYASSMFEKNKLTFESEKTNTSIEKRINGKSNNRYELTTNNSYMYLSRIDNTLLYMKSDISNKDNIKSFVKILNY